MYVYFSDHPDERQWVCVDVMPDCNVPHLYVYRSVAVPLREVIHSRGGIHSREETIHSIEVKGQVHSIIIHNIIMSVHLLSTYLSCCYV